MSDAPQIPDFMTLWKDALEYWIDTVQRTTLTADTLRERANNMLDHAAQGMPPLLKFPYEVILDGRTEPKPVNYALLRIVPPEGWQAKEGAAPIVIIDPRAGHGPGIGGFKGDSEIGIAIEEGHPTYFVSFTPHPCPDQTLADVEQLEVKFLEIVNNRHPELGRPIVYGNCQAGWATAMLGADRPDVTGPMVVNGAPLSYWAGEAGVNPMRVSGGLMGGAWGANLLTDLNAGELDGAWLVLNFENLNPANTLVSKLYRLYSRVDTERERFLEFERWWTGFYFLGEREFEWIVGELFVGNDLEQGELELAPGHKIDLRNIRDPLVVFASSGDNITPPQQALHWISEVYPTTEELKKNDQRIVYLINPHVGHLGIFVSARVAQREHRAIIESLDKISELAPGLYEMKILGATGETDPAKDQWNVVFEERDVSDVRYPYDPGEFRYTEGISDQGVEAYKTSIRPWIKMMVNPFTAQALQWLHPSRLSRQAWSERLNPALASLAPLAEIARQNRQPAKEDNFFCQLERQNVAMIEESLEAWTKVRDRWAEMVFKLLPP
jgi:hypothetical protein